MKLYVKDFDSNGSIDQLMCYTIDGKQYTFLLKDELERPLPVLRKAYLTYREVAGKDVQYLFYDLFKDYTELTAETLESACCLNDGKGNFTRIVLPDGLQLSPLMAFGKMGNELIAAGNFYGVMPYEGKYDAMFPTIFSFEQESKSFKINGVISQLRTEARDIKILEESGKSALVMIAGNNEPLHFFRKE